MLEREDAGLGDHGAVVDAVAVVHVAARAAPPPRHRGHHRLQPPVAADAADQQHVLPAAVRHGPLRHLDEHGEDRLLERVAQIRRRVPPC